MIKVTRFDRSELYVNAELIEFVEGTPDTVITTTTGKKIVAREPVDEVIERIVTYRRQVYGARPVRGRRST
ncbi:MAG: flagellar FlbD family protein [Bacillota bacterium]